ncbi:MAG TPA: efflux RND transporter permease subunit, partial [Fimbriimonas sp.]|nr:efflux RND transporter permease subunit [Fimbriimonas sp.]
IVSAGLLWPSVGREQIPQTDTGDLSVRVRLSIGTGLPITDRVMQRVEGILLKDPDVETVVVGAGARVGLRGSGNGPGHEGSAQVRLKSERKDRTEDVVKRLTKSLSTIPGVRAQITPYDVVANMLGGNQTGVSVDVFGPDLDQLMKEATDVRDAIEGVPGLENADVSVEEATPEVQVKVDREKARTLDVSFRDVAATIRAATIGDLASYYQENGMQYPIYVQVPKSERRTVEQVANIPIIRPGKDPIQLSQVAEVKRGMGPNAINRLNRQRLVSVNGRIADRAESDVQADIKKILDGHQFTEGYHWSFGIQQQERQEEYAGLGLAVLLAIALIYMLLASQFESFIYPLVVLTSVPLCSIGMVLALFISGRAFGLTAFIGLLMLIGIVVKNGILLVDYTNQLRQRGVPRDEAILTAGPTRLRPILMTTLAAIFGMLPLAIGLGSGSEMYTPLATVVIGGLATSTMLTLFVVPTVYTFFDDLAKRFHKDDLDLNRAVLVEPSAEAAERTAAR